jgi:hypothetical protein
MVQQIAEILFGRVQAHPVAYAVLVGASVVILCSLYLELEPTLRGFWRRAAHFALRHGFPVALLQVLLHLWLVGR